MVMHAAVRIVLLLLSCFVRKASVARVTLESSENAALPKRHINGAKRQETPRTKSGRRNQVHSCKSAMLYIQHLPIPPCNSALFTARRPHHHAPLLHPSQGLSVSLSLQAFAALYNVFECKKQGEYVIAIRQGISIFLPGL